ncbi:MAG: hypothetical protein KAW41_04795 [Candidatus Diapherotrites archaeon]|nr:hypothetical protein [Candidatus Diapherotrites archaeon]
MPSEEEQIINLIAQELMAGKGQGAVINELVQAGLPKNEAATVVNAVAQQISRRGGGGGGAAPMPRGGGTNWGMWIMIGAIGVLVYIIFLA